MMEILASSLPVYFIRAKKTGSLLDCFHMLLVSELVLTFPNAFFVFFSLCSITVLKMQTWQNHLVNAQRQ